MLSGNFAEMATSTPFRDLLHAANLRHGTDGFTSPPKEGVLRILYIHTYIYEYIYQEYCIGRVLFCTKDTYRVSQEECEILRESVPYVKLYRYNPKHLYQKLNGYGDNGQRSLKL